jgi:hypothetical protein
MLNAGWNDGGSCYFSDNKTCRVANMIIYGIRRALTFLAIYFSVYSNSGREGERENNSKSFVFLVKEIEEEKL